MSGTQEVYVASITSLYVNYGFKEYKVEASSKTVGVYSVYEDAIQALLNYIIYKTNYIDDGFTAIPEKLINIKTEEQLNVFIDMYRVNRDNDQVNWYYTIEKHSVV